MNFRIVRGTIVDADVLHLHSFEIELAGAPGVFVAAAGTAVIEGRDKQPVFALFGDHRSSDPRHEIKRIIPAGWLKLAIAPDQGVRETLELGIALTRVTHLGDARAANRPEARVHDTFFVRLDYNMNVTAVLLHDVVHRRRVPGGRFGRLLLRKVDAELVLAGRGTPFVAGVPSIRLVSASDDAVVADDVVLLRIRGNDRETANLTLVAHVMISLRECLKGGHREARRRPPRRRRLCRQRAAHTAGDSVWPAPRPADRLSRSRSANSGRGNSSSCRTC